MAPNSEIEEVAGRAAREQRTKKRLDVGALAIAGLALGVSVFSYLDDARAVNYESRQDAYVDFIDAGYALLDGCSWTADGPGCTSTPSAVDRLENAFLYVRLSGSTAGVETARGCLRSWGVLGTDETEASREVCKATPAGPDELRTQLFELTNSFADDLKGPIPVG